MPPNYDYKDLKVHELRDVFHSVPFFMAQWKTIQYHYHQGLLYDGEKIKPEYYNPRYTGELRHIIPLELQDKYALKPLRVFYERICCAGNNGCTLVPVSNRANKKISK